MKERACRGVVYLSGRTLLSCLGGFVFPCPTHSVNRVHFSCACDAYEAKLPRYDTVLQRILHDFGAWTGIYWDCAIYWRWFLFYCFQDNLGPPVYVYVYANNAMRWLQSLSKHFARFIPALDNMTVIIVCLPPRLLVRWSQCNIAKNWVRITPSSLQIRLLWYR